MEQGTESGAFTPTHARWTPNAPAPRPMSPMAQDEVKSLYNSLPDWTRIHKAILPAWKRGANSFSKEVHWTFLSGIAMDPAHPVQRELFHAIHGPVRPAATI
eukprot:5010959-Heterocapsa_arctica.AAC.1